MEERKSDFTELFLCALKLQEIPYEYAVEIDNTVSCWTDFLSSHGTGLNLPDALHDLVNALKVYSRAYFEDFDYWFSHNPDDIFRALKVLISSDEELLRCLTGKN